jgi:hypothetical protein
MTRSIFLLAALAIAANSFAGDESRDCACSQCGCQAHCHKRCRLVCEMKDVKKVCYTCKCEDFCVPGPSCVCGEVCECDPCSSGCSCKCLSCLFGDGTTHRKIWKPSCETRLFTRNKLYKYEVTKQVPTYKWVVEYCCNSCQTAAPCATDGIPPAAATVKSAESGSKLPTDGQISPPAELDMPQTAAAVNVQKVQPATWSQPQK